MSPFRKILCWMAFHSWREKQRFECNPCFHGDASGIIVFECEHCGWRVRWGYGCRKLACFPPPPASEKNKAAYQNSHRLVQRLPLLVLCLLLLIGCKGVPKAQPRPTRAPDTTKATAQAVSKELEATQKRIDELADELLKNLESPTISIPDAVEDVGRVKDEAKGIGDQSTIIKVKLIPELDQHASDLDKMQKWGEGEQARADAAEKALNDGTRKALRGWGTALIVLGCVGLGLGGWLIFAGNLKGGVGVLAGGVCLVGSGSMVLMVGEHLVLIACISGGIILAGIVYLILSKVGFERIKTAFGVVVKTVDKVDPLAQSLKPEIEKQAGDLAALVKAEVGKVKAALKKQKPAEAPKP